MAFQQANANGLVAGTPQTNTFFAEGGARPISCQIGGWFCSYPYGSHGYASFDEACVTGVTPAVSSQVWGWSGNTPAGVCSIYHFQPLDPDCPSHAYTSPTIGSNQCVCDGITIPDSTATNCICPPGEQFDVAGTSCVRKPPETCTAPDVIDPATGQCVRCPIEALTPLPANDACTQALENLSSTQAQKDAACGTLSQSMEDGKACLEKKLSSLGTPIPLSVGVGVRSDAYQKHFREIWDQMEKLVRVTKMNPTMQAACSARRAEIAAEKGCDNAGRCKSCFTASSSQRSHCLKGRPSSSNTAPHTLGNAIDVSESRTIAPLKKFLKARIPPQNIQQFLDEPPDCKLKWGGTFTDNYDPIHFQVR